VRRYLPYIYGLQGEGSFPAFSIAIYDAYCAATGREPTHPNRDFALRPYIHYAGVPGTIEWQPYFTVIDDDYFDSDYYRDKIVLVGVTASSMQTDSYLTPASGVQPMYGVEIHANIVANLLSGEGVTPAPPFVSYLFFLLMTGLSLFFGIKFKFVPAKLLTFFLGICAVGGIFLLSLLQFNLFMSIFYTLAAMTLIFLCDVVVGYAEHYLGKQHITNLFGRYMAPEVLAQIIEDGEKNIRLGGEVRHIAVLFVDIRGFTSMSEILPPEQVVAILNEYLTLATEAIFKYAGTLDKYLGDCAMALYNAPRAQEDYCLAAVRSALYMRDRGAELYEGLTERYGRGVRFGIGINAGLAVIGNIGSPMRMDYTAIGDAVNTAARLQGSAEAGQILISGDVYQAVKGLVDVRPLGELKFKGCEAPVETYELIGLRGERGESIHGELQLTPQ